MANELDLLKNLAPVMEEVVHMIEDDAARMAAELKGVHDRLSGLVERVRVKRDLALHHVNEFRDMRVEVANVAADINRFLDGVGTKTQVPLVTEKKEQ